MALCKGKTLNDPAEFLVSVERRAGPTCQVVRVIVHVRAYFFAQYACEVLDHVLAFWLAALFGRSSGLHALLRFALCDVHADAQTFEFVLGASLGL